MLRPTLALVLGLATGCGEDLSSAADAGPPQRRVDARLSLDERGVSEPLVFEIPADTRSVAVIARGSGETLYALGALELGGTELVGLDLSAPLADTMRERYHTEQVGLMPGDLHQSIRLGTFSHVYPYAPGQVLPAGPAALRVVSDASGGEVEVTVLMAADDGASVLHVNVLAISESLVYAGEDELAFLPEVRALLAPAGISVVVDEVASRAGTGYSELSDFTEPQETPQSQSAQLAELGRELVSSDALNVFVVDALPAGVGGLSLGTPGPADADSYYWGVVARHSADATVLGRTVAHELAHFLALQHVENRGLSGQTYADPIEDTRPGSGNLMEGGTKLTVGQAFALSRSPLLRLE